MHTTCHLRGQAFLVANTPLPGRLIYSPNYNTKSYTPGIFSFYLTNVPWLLQLETGKNHPTKLPYYFSLSLFYFPSHSFIFPLLFCLIFPSRALSLFYAHPVCEHILFWPNDIFRSGCIETNCHYLNVFF